MTISLAGMSPLVVNATTLAITNLRGSPNLNFQAVRHSGNEFPSVGALPGAMPRMSFSTPFLAAYNLIGLKLLIATTFDVFFATFAAGLRQSGANHSKFGLTASCSACLYITGARVAQNGLLMADVEVVYLSNDGKTHPVTLTNSVSLPSLGSEPVLHTLGPYSLNTTRKDGLKNSGFSNGINLHVPINDGDSYPRTVGWMGAAPKLAWAHEDAKQMATDLGWIGANITTSVALYFCGIDPTTHLRMTTGISMIITSGRVWGDGYQWDMQQPATASLMAESLASGSTHPIAVTSGATIP